jgi:hypothetical protein
MDERLAVTDHDLVAAVMPAATTVGCLGPGWVGIAARTNATALRAAVVTAVAAAIGAAITTRRIGST